MNKIPFLFLGLFAAMLLSSETLAFFYEGTPPTATYTIGDTYTVSLKAAHGIRQIEGRHEDKTFRLQNFLDSERPNDRDLPPGGFVMEIRTAGCGKRWKKSELVAWESVKRKKRTGLGTNVYQTVGQEFPEGFQNGIFFTKKKVKFEVLFDSQKTDLKMVYKILRTIRAVGSDCKNNSPTPSPSSSISSAAEGYYKKLRDNVTQGPIHLENVVFAVEEQYALRNPDWKSKADEVIDSINSVLGKTTKKRFKIDKYLTFPLEKRWNDVPQDPDYHVSNGSYGGLTFIYWPYRGEINTSIEKTGMLSTATERRINEQLYINVFVSGDEQYSELRGRDYFQQNFANETLSESFPWPAWEVIYRRNFYTVLHELGHGLGLAWPEWYFYEFKDYTGVSPILGDKSWQNEFPNEPMGGSNSIEDYEYSPLSSYIINHNLDHELALSQISEITSNKTIVRVKDTTGKTVADAQVLVFAGRKGCWYCFESDAVGGRDTGNGRDANGKNILLQTLRTNSSGEIEIESPFLSWELNESNADDMTKFIGKIIKVSKMNPNGRQFTGAAYVTAFDLGQTKILQSGDIHYVDVTIQ